MRRLLYSLALGPHPQRELTLTPRLGSTCPRLGVAAGASLAAGPPPALVVRSKGSYGEPRRTATGAKAAPPPRPNADASPQLPKLPASGYQLPVATSKTPNMNFEARSW